jgi:pimeloyl-ACP methyl ester carboxylesterase
MASAFFVISTAVNLIFVKFTSLILSILLCLAVRAQEEIVVLHTSTGDLEGSLLIPEGKKDIPLVLIISGSGPTDRNGNNEEMENNSLKMLAQEFQKNGIASFRFDKRGIGQSGGLHLDEMEMRPENFINDIRGWIDLLSKDKRFSKLIVAGHSEGSLLGMIASINNPRVHGYVSIAGAGRPIDEVLKEQFSGVPLDIKTVIYGMLDKLKKGDTLSNVPPIFYAVFRPSIQPYMIAWMKYDPKKEIAKLKVPVLIVNGTTDLQVKELDAHLLAKGQPKAELRIIKNMNHVLKDCDTLSKQAQEPIYNNPALPLNAEFSRIMVEFVVTHFTGSKSSTVPVQKD